MSPDSDPVSVPGRSPTASACEPYFDFVGLSLNKGRNAKAIYQDLVDDHGFTGGNQSVKRFVRGIIITPPGEERGVVQLCFNRARSLPSSGRLSARWVW